MNGTALPAIEAPSKPTPEPDNRSVEDILAFLGEDTKSTSSNGKKSKGKKGKATKDSNSKQDSKTTTSITPSKTSANSTDSSKTTDTSSSTPGSPKESQNGATTQHAPSSAPSFPQIKTAVESVPLPITKIDFAPEDKSITVEHVVLAGKPKTLNVSASSSSSAASSTSVFSSSTRVSISCDECAQDLCSCSAQDSTISASAPQPNNILSGSMLSHLTFPSPFSATSASSNNTPAVGSPQLPPGIATLMHHHHQHPTTATPPQRFSSPSAVSPSAPMLYQPLSNFFPTAPPGLDLPPGLSVPPGLSIPHPHDALPTPTPLTSSASLHSSDGGILDPASSFAIETSSYPMPVLTSSSSSAQYYWGMPEEEDILKTSQDGIMEDDPDFELELAEFRQSLELGLRSPGSTYQRNLHSSGNHSSQSGNKPVGAY